VATRCFSRQNGSYWWPRRKSEGRSQGRLSLGLNGELGQRGYNGHTEERKVYKFPEGFDFVQHFPHRNAERDSREIKRPTSNRLRKKRKAEVWTSEDLESYRNHFAEEDIVRLKANSGPSPATPVIIPPKRRGRPPKLESEKKARTNVRGCGRQPPKLIVTDSSDDLVEVTVNDGSAQAGGVDKDGRALVIAGEVDNQAATKTGAAHAEGEIGPRQIAHPSPTNSGALEQTDINDEPEVGEELRSIPIAPSRSDSDPNSSILLDILEDGHDEFAADLSFRADMGPESLPQDHDDELERALQHFNLGMWHKPWRPLPPKSTEADLEKESQKGLFKQLELQKEKVEFNRTIHILGLGTAGKYIAHSLAGLPNGPPVTLLMHRPLIMQQWHDEGAAIRILINGVCHVQTGFHIESSANFQRRDPTQRFPGFGPNLEHSAEPPSSAIDMLIVTTDANTTFSALFSIRHRLRKSTTICFIQDGLGILEKINKNIFPDPYERPTYILGSMSHRLASTERHFTIVEKRFGEIKCSKLPQVLETKEGYFSPTIKREDFSWSPQAQHLVGSLLRAPWLNTKSIGHKSFFMSQLEQLVIDAVIGPLSVAFDCSNDQLLYNYHVSRNMQFLLQEISHIIQSFPELATLDGVPQIFAAERLESVVLSCIKKTGRNVSSMLQHVRAGKKTDIDFYNGYLVLRATELGIDCPRNLELLHLVKGKQAMKSREKNLYIPFRDEF